MTRTEAETKREMVVRLMKSGMRTTDIVSTMSPLGYSKSSVMKALNRFRTTKSTADKPRTGRPRSVRTPKVIAKVRERIRRNSARSSRRMAAQLNLTTTSVHRVLKNDLGLCPYKQSKAQEIPIKAKDKRAARAKLLLSQHDFSNIMFTDEKKWTVEAQLNPQNNRVWAKSQEKAKQHKNYHCTRSHSPAHVMVWAAITTKGKFALVFLNNDKLTAAKYRDQVLSKHVKSKGDDFFGGEAWTFQQDGAPCHTANTTQNYLRSNVPNFWSKEKWPPYSPDLNPCDYYLWGRLEAIVNTKRYTSIDALKVAITSAWKSLDDNEVALACSSFQSRLMACVRAKGNLF